MGPLGFPACLDPVGLTQRASAGCPTAVRRATGPGPASGGRGLLGPIQLSQGAKEWAPVIHRLGGAGDTASFAAGAQGAERAAGGASAFITIHLDRVVRGHTGVLVRLVQPQRQQLCHISGAGWPGLAWRSGPRKHVAAHRRPRCWSSSIRVLQGCDVKGLGILLATTLVIIGDNVLPDILLLQYHQRFLLLPPQGHEEHHQGCTRAHKPPSQLVPARGQVKAQAVWPEIASPRSDIWQRLL